VAGLLTEAGRSADKHIDISVGWSAGTRPPTVGQATPDRLVLAYLSAEGGLGILLL